MKTNKEKLSAVLEKRGYKNEDLINEIEQIYNKKQLPTHGVNVSLLDTVDQLIELYEERLIRANRNRNHIEAHNNQFVIDVLDYLKAVVKHNNER